MTQFTSLSSYIREERGGGGSINNGNIIVEGTSFCYTCEDKCTNYVVLSFLVLPCWLFCLNHSYLPSCLNVNVMEKILLHPCTRFRNYNHFLHFKLDRILLFPLCISKKISVPSSPDHISRSALLFIIKGLLPVLV